MSGAELGKASAIPVWLTAAALGFWGWWIGAPGLAFPLMVLVVAPRLVRRRFAFRGQEFHRALDVCWVLLLGGILLTYSQSPAGGVLRGFTRWLPVVMFPAVMAQGWSLAGRLPVSALLPFPGWRKQVDPRSMFDVMPMFLAASLLAASVSEGGRPEFYAGLVALAGAGLWVVRVRGARPAWAVGVLVVAAAGGWAGGIGIGEVQQWVENRMLNLVSRLRGDESSRRLFRTAIGQVGEVGGGSRVVFRMRAFGQWPMPRLLRVSVFTTWNEGTWFAPRAESEKVELVGDEWRLDRRPGREGAAYVEWVPDLTGRVVPLPGAARAIADLPATRVERTWVGVVKAETSVGVVAYRVDYGPDSEWELAPREEDASAIPLAEVPCIEATNEDWGLSGIPAEEVVRRIETRFQREFRYTTKLEDVVVPDIRAQTPLGRFLLGNRAGHCEYFATAAVLLLRSAGVPARYVTGYSVGAGERRGDEVTVRESASHAWVRVWIDNAWRDFDPTPSAGLEGEAVPLTAMQRLERMIDDLRFALARWWWVGEKRLLRQAYWLVVPLLAGLLWRLRGLREATGAGDAGGGEGVLEAWPGLDSEWYAVAERLEKEGWLRDWREPVRSWRGRLEEGGWPAPEVARVTDLLALHQRLRFDPEGLAERDRGRLRSEAAALRSWVESRRPGLSAGATRA